MQQPRLTVLMPVYNAERFLAEAIDSVLKQTFTAFEFLILDDGSSDRSVSIIKSYTDPRIRLYQNEQNMGISPTLNKGIALATTPLVARMDADDICYPERLQMQYNYLLANPDCALVSSWVRVITENGDFVRQDDFKSPYYYYNLTFECWIYHPTIVFRKEAVQQIGGYTVPYSEDFELFWQLSRKFKIHNLPEVLLDYRITSQSLHQVQKKTEYDIAQHQQVVRNLQYYAGREYKIPEDYIECLRHNFIPLLKKSNVQDIMSCLKILDVITRKIVETPNPNRDPSAIAEAAYYKRLFITSFYFRHLSPFKALYLISKTNSWSYVTKSLKNRLKRMVTH